MNIALITNIDLPGAEEEAARTRQVLTHYGHQVWTTHKPERFAVLPAPRHKPWDVVIFAIEIINDVPAAAKARQEMNALHFFSIGRYDPEDCVKVASVEEVVEHIAVLS